MTADRAVIADLRSTVAQQQTAITAFSSAVKTQAATPAASTSYGPFTVTGKDVYLTGYNLHIQSGSGSTTGTVNGYGNLIIGYNETRAALSAPARTT